MHLDGGALLQLDVLESHSISRSVGKDLEKGSLFALLNQSATAMGKRLLRFWLLHPLLDASYALGSFFFLDS